MRPMARGQILEVIIGVRAGHEGISSQLSPKMIRKSFVVVDEQQRIINIRKANLTEGSALDTHMRNYWGAGNW